MESCFATPKTELIHQTSYPTREAAKRDLFAYIKGYYNRQMVDTFDNLLESRKAFDGYGTSSIHR